MHKVKMPRLRMCEDLIDFSQYLLKSVGKLNFKGKFPGDNDRVDKRSFEVNKRVLVIVKSSIALEAKKVLSKQTDD